MNELAWALVISTAIVCFCWYRIACLKAQTLLEVCQFLRHGASEEEDREDGRWHD